MKQQKKLVLKTQKIILIFSVIFLSFGLAISKAKYTSQEVYEFFNNKKLFTSSKTRVMLDFQPSSFYYPAEIGGNTERLKKTSLFNSVQKTHTNYTYTSKNKEVMVYLEITSYKDEKSANYASEYYGCSGEMFCDSVKYTLLRKKSNVIVYFTFLVNKPDNKEINFLNRIFDEL